MRLVPMMLAALVALPSLAKGEEAPSHARELATNARAMLESNAVLAAYFARNALKEDPQEPVALEVLAESFRLRRQFDEARGWAEKLLAVRPDDPAARLLRAAIALDQGRREEALDRLAAVDRTKLDASAKARADAIEVAARTRAKEVVAPRIVVYGAAWCGYCKGVKRWLREHGHAFAERDIERDPGADEELDRRCRDAGLRRGGIPITDIDGELVVGFDEQKLARILR